ncbi:MAG: hypothetical protein NZ519_02565 [Bacteroidia bacterium]|nr:hypothetical protein [Bacteroidia bacterium]MDW8302180.1 hypothetical protein [Bacteroidia bacterium]
MKHKFVFSLILCLVNLVPILAQQKDSIIYSEEKLSDSDFRRSRWYRYTVRGDGYEEEWCLDCGKTRETFMFKINLVSMFMGKYIAGVEQKIYNPISIYAEAGLIDKMYEDIHPTNNKAEVRLHGYEYLAGLRYYYGQSFNQSREFSDLDGMYLSAEIRYGKLQDVPLNKSPRFISEVQQYSLRLGWQLRLGCYSYLDMSYGPTYTQVVRFEQDANFPIKNPYYEGIRVDFRFGLGIAF